MAQARTQSLAWGLSLFSEVAVRWLYQNIYCARTGRYFESGVLAPTASNRRWPVQLEPRSFFRSDCRDKSRRLCSTRPSFTVLQHNLRCRLETCSDFRVVFRVYMPMAHVHGTASPIVGRLGHKAGNLLSRIILSLQQLANGRPSDTTWQIDAAP